MTRNGTAGPTLPATGRAPLCWTVIAVDGAGQGHGNCGHAHDTADEATACPWDPPRPVVCDLLVRQVRREIFERRPAAAPMQLALALALVLVAACAADPSPPMPDAATDAGPVDKCEAVCATGRPAWCGANGACVCDDGAWCWGPTPG